MDSLKRRFGYARARRARAVPLLLAAGLLAAGLLAAGLLVPWAAAPVRAADRAAVERGRGVFDAAGGCGCHTDYKNKGPALAGGRAIKTPFGVIYGTNITPDAETGLGKWSEAEFVRAMREGKNPQGEDLFPVFPYTSFTRMTDGDLQDLWAYLQSVPAVKLANKPNGMLPPFGLRFSVTAWKMMNFKPGRFAPDPARPAEINRGGYLVTALGHCTECHTPRWLDGSLKSGQAYSGSKDGPEGQLAPNITPDSKTGIGDWSVKDIVYYLQTGNKPDGDQAEGLMAEQIDTGYKHLSTKDLEAIAAYLKALPPIVHQLQRK